MMLPEQLLLSEIEKRAQLSEIITAAKYLNLSYNLFTTDHSLWNEVKSAFGQDYEQIINCFDDQVIANKFINLLLLKYYPCERTVKHALVDNLKDKKDTVLFEMPVLGSRVDVGRINGNSYAYEIKTELDSLKRLKKQISDYSRVYEYVYVVIAPIFFDEVVALIPDYCGIWIYNHNKETSSIKFSKKRTAKKSPNLCPYSQLKCLSQQSLLSILPIKEIKGSPASKEARIQKILELYSSRTINSKFKVLIKQAYANNWEFIRNHYPSILPIDMQAVFNSPIDPNVLYYKNFNDN